MQFDFQTQELTIKLVYYGPALSGKTTNLQAIHRLFDVQSRGRLMTLETRDDRTLFFDLLPLAFKLGRMPVRIKLFTVPGQVIHVATRRLVLQGADGVAFIADSQISETKANAAAFLDLKENLREAGLELKKMPLVIQFNKRDLPGVRTDNEIDQLAQRGSEPVFKAVAMTGAGVAETFLGLMERTWMHLDREHQMEAKFGMKGSELIDALKSRLHLDAKFSIPPEPKR